MAKRNSHPDVEFHALGPSGRDTYFKTFDEAAAFVVQQSLRGGGWSNLNVLIHSESGARWYGGEDGLDQYRSDPNASVFERIIIKANPEGTVS